MKKLICVVEEAPEGGYTVRAPGESIITEADTGTLSLIRSGSPLPTIKRSRPFLDTIGRDKGSWHLFATSTPHMTALWWTAVITLTWAGCAGTGAAVPEEDVFCRKTAERWEHAPEGRAHALIELYYEVEASATREDIFRLCKQHEREALEHPERYRARPPRVSP